MIKKLSLKFVLVFLVLAVGVFTVSTCYAALSTTVVETAFTKDDFYAGSNFISACESKIGYTLDESNSKILCYRNGSGSGSNAYYVDVFYGANCNNIAYVEFEGLNGYGLFKDSNGNTVTVDYLCGYVQSDGLFSGTWSISKTNGYISSVTKDNGTFYIADITDYTVKVVDDVIYESNALSVEVIHEFQSDTSAKVNFTVEGAPDGAYLQYSLTGVEISTDLDSPVKLRNPITYTPGITNLVVKENTKVYWALYDVDGNCLDTNVYQVPEYDVQVENADKDIEYTVTYNEDNTLATLNVNVINGEFSDKLYYTENGMISNDFAGKILFPASRSLEINHNCNMHIILYDYFGNLITAEYVTINEIGLIPESNFKVDVTTGDKTVYIRPRLYNVLQSRFYSIEYDVILDTFTSSKDIDLFQDGVYVGNVTDTSKTYTCGSDSELKFYQSVGTSNITVTFRIINAETGVTCITRTVSFKIGLNDESTGVTDSTTNGNSDNSFITSNGSSVSNNGGYSNVSWGQISSMINTNSDFWQIIKNILNCLPIWITAPIFFFISAIVTICLTKIVLSIVGHLVG